MCLSTSRMAWPSAFSRLRLAQISLRMQRRQALGRFVEDEELRVGHQAAADRQHLLLAAGELVAHVAAALGEASGTSDRCP